MLGEKGPRRCGWHLTLRLVITSLVETNKQLITILSEANSLHPSHFPFPLFLWTSFGSKYMRKGSVKNSFLGTLKIEILLAWNNTFLGKVRMSLGFARTKLTVHLFRPWTLPDLSPPHSPPTPFLPAWQAHPLQPRGFKRQIFIFELRQ